MPNKHILFFYILKVKNILFYFSLIMYACLQLKYKKEKIK